MTAFDLVMLAQAVGYGTLALTVAIFGYPPKRTPRWKRSTDE